MLNFKIKKELINLCGGGHSNWYFYQQPDNTNPIVNTLSTYSYTDFRDQDMIFLFLSMV